MYVHCPHCDAELHTNIPYCNHCGKNTGYTNTGTLTTEYNNKGLVDNATKQPAKEVLTNDAGEQLQSTEATLAQRGTRYGEFRDNSEVTVAIEDIIQERLWDKLDGPEEPGNWDRYSEFVPPYIQEAIHMIAHKLSRIACGDHTYDDNWRDIAGYATLVVEELNKDK